MIRTHFVVLGGFVGAVLAAAALGVASGGPVRVEEANGFKFLVNPEFSGSGVQAGMGIEGFLITKNNCVGISADSRGHAYSALVWPQGSRIVPHKAWLSMDTRFGDFALEGDYYEGGGYILPATRLPAEVVAACPAERYVFLHEFALVEVVQ